jgi:RND family efflux transporter MFP subunit
MTSEVDIKQLAIVRGEAPAKTVRRRPRILTRYVIPGALIAGFAAVALWAAQDVLNPPQPVWVVPVLASQSTLQREGAPLFQAAGWIEPRPTPIRVAALAPGVVERLLVVQDQPLKAGEAVAELVKQDAQLLYDRALANVKLREAELKEMEAALKAARTRLEQPVHLEAALGEAEATLAGIVTELQNLPFEIQRAAAQLEFAEADYQGKLSSKGSVAGRAIKEAKSTVDSARATLAELEGRTESLENQRTALVSRRDALRTQLELLAEEKQAHEAAEANIAAADARLQQARVALAEAKLRLNRMTVRAPVDGRVYQLMAYPGTNLTGGMSPVADADGSTVVTLYQPESLQVRVDVRFEDIPKVSLGQLVQINNAALPALISGHVLFVSSEANIQKNTLQVKVGVDSPQAILKPEMLVDVTFLAPKATEPNADVVETTRIYLPQSLVLRNESGGYVWLADQSSGVARKTPVKVGKFLAGGLVEITDGLSIGSRVVTRGHENLEDGDRIRVVSEDATATAAASGISIQQAPEHDSGEGH